LTYFVYQEGSRPPIHSDGGEGRLRRRFACLLPLFLAFKVRRTIPPLLLLQSCEQAREKVVATADGVRDPRRQLECAGVQGLISGYERCALRAPADENYADVLADSSCRPYDGRVAVGNARTQQFSQLFDVGFDEP